MSVRQLLSGYRYHSNVLYFGFTLSVHDAADVTDFIDVAVDDNNLVAIYYNGGIENKKLVFYTIISGSVVSYERGSPLSLDTTYTVEMKIDFTHSLVTPRIDSVAYSDFAYTVGSMANLFFGARFSFLSTNNHTLDNLTVGTTTWGATDIFSANFNDMSIVPPFDSVTGTGISAATGALVINNAGSDAYATKAISFP